jgi:hypothetical protein
MTWEEEAWLAGMTWEEEAWLAGMTWPGGVTLEEVQAAGIRNCLSCVLLWIMFNAAGRHARGLYTLGRALFQGRSPPVRGEER